MSRPSTSILLLCLLPACATPRARESAIPDMALTATMPAVNEDRATVIPQDLETRSNRAPVGVGFTLSPTMLLFGGALDLKVDERVTAGPALHVAVDDDDFLFAPFGQVKFYPIADEGQNVQPFLQGGAGLAFLDRDRRGDDWGFLLNFGGGIRYAAGDGYTLGSTVLFNFVPDEVVDEDFYFTWELIQLVVTF